MIRKEGKNLLIIRMSALGDVAMTIPAIYSLAHQYPHYNVMVMTQPILGGLFVNAPDNVRLITVNKRDYRGILGLCRLVRRLGKEDIDEVADFHNVLYSWFIDAYFLFHGKAVSVLKKHRFNRIPLLRRRSKVRTNQRSYTLRYFDVLKKLGLSVVPNFYSLFKDAPAPALPVEFQLKGDRRWVGVAPFARYYNKTYPLELMRETIGLLTDRDDYTVFLFGGGEKEKTILDLWSKENRSAISVAGRLSLEQELSLMSQLDVMVSMDSANMHMASLVDTPVISLWGGTSPHCGFMGWRQDRENAIVTEIACQPCTISGSDFCPLHNFACMYAVTPEYIVRKVEQSIAKTRSMERNRR